VFAKAPSVLAGHDLNSNNRTHSNKNQSHRPVIYGYDVLELVHDNTISVVITTLCTKVQMPQ
jgi:hypothetical protein